MPKLTYMHLTFDLLSLSLSFFLSLFLNLLNYLIISACSFTTLLKHPFIGFGYEIGSTIVNVLKTVLCDFSCSFVIYVNESELLSSVK